MNPKCTLCGAAEANAIHALFYCPFVIKVWKEKDILIPRWNPLDKVLHNFLDQLNSMTSTTILVGWVWAIWKRRCEPTHQDSKTTSRVQPLRSKNVDWASKMIEEFQRTCLRKNGLPAKASWSPLIESIRDCRECVVVLSDASFNQCTGNSTASIVILNSEGNTLGIKTCQLNRCPSPLEAELGAILEGAKAAKAHRNGKLFSGG